MGLLFQVKGKQINIDVTDFGIVRGYEFRNSVPDSRYAKGYQDERPLIIRGSIARTLAKDKENGTDVMEQVRKWAKIEYKNRDTYYHWAKVTHIHRDEIIRAITYPDAFIYDYTEEIDPHTGDGTYIITLMQKLDKRIDIIVDPFNEVHPSKSQLQEEWRQRREAERERQAALLAATLPPEDENSPYWVRDIHLAPSRIQTLRRIEHVFDRPGGSSDGSSFVGGPVSDVVFREGAILNVVRAGRYIGSSRGANMTGHMWYMVEHPTRPGYGVWIPERTVDNSGVVDVLVEGILSNDERVIMVQDPEDTEHLNSVAQVRGRAWGDKRPGNPGRILIDNCGEGYDFRSSTPREYGTRQIGDSNNRGLVDGAIVTLVRRSVQIPPGVPLGAGGTAPARSEHITRVHLGNTWYRVGEWKEGREIASIIGGQLGFTRMRMSQQGIDMLMGFELTPDYGEMRDIVILDSQRNITYVYPHFVMRARRDGQPGLESDGGITMGYGVWISQAMFNDRNNPNYDWARQAINSYVRYPPNFSPDHTRYTHRVPYSSPMPIAEVRNLFQNQRLPDFETALNDFLESPRQGYSSVQLEQHQFDALVSFTYQMGQNTWTLPARREWNINVLIRNGPPFDTDMEFAHRAFTDFLDTPERRQREFEVFFNGH